MAYFRAEDGTALYFKQWGPLEGEKVVFCHGWPLSSDAWDSQMHFLATQGYHCIAYDRRGHGRSDQPWHGNDMDTYADDLKALIDHLELSSVSLVGHSTGGGEVARYIGRHGTGKVSKAVLVGSVTPILMQTECNPQGVPKEVFDDFRKKYVQDRAKFFVEVASGPFYNFDKSNASVSEGLIEAWFHQGMMSGFANAFDCIKAFSETDFTEDLRKIDVPTLIIHGDEDQVVPIATSAVEAKKLVPNAILKIYNGGSHGLADTSRERLNEDLLNFLKA